MISRDVRWSRIAVHLLRHADWVLPPGREEWSQAMRNELEHLPSGAAAVSWALGCILVSYRERISMVTGSLKSIPRWLLALEMAVCLVPLTWFFIAVVAMTMRGVVPLHVGILAGSAALSGPVGVVVVLRILVDSSGSIGRTAATIIALLGAWTVLLCVGRVITVGAPASEFWRDLVLIALLPAWAVVHLLLIGARSRAPTAS